jgi:hypothetical protein
MAGHGTTRTGRFPSREDLQIVYPQLTTASMAAGRLAILLRTRYCSTPAVHRSPLSSRALRFGVAVISLVVLSAVGANSAMAKTKCADQVVADWFNDGRVDKIYPLECYRRAIKSLPPDVVDYSNAKEEIGRALAFAKQGKPDPGGKGPTPTTGTTPTGTTPTGTTPTGTTPTGTTPTSETPTATQQTTDTSGPSSVPIPLLVLGGLAVLLLAAGSAGYLRRRMNGDGDGDGTPPASA